jgi:pSer/pThr/pTyr-binding forkhead associated (FHA) protein
MTEWTLTLNEKPIKRFNIKEGWELIIGRGTEADVIVDNTAISRQHSSLGLKNGQYILKDLGSLNGTFVNGNKIEGITPISTQDFVNLGKFRLSIAEDSPQPKASLSYGAHPNTDDRTIIINTKTDPIKPRAQTPSGPSLKLVLIGGSATPEQINLKGKSSIKIGKEASSDMVLKGFTVGKAQLYIVKHTDGYKLIPQKSWAATFVNGTKIKAERLLRKGDIIKIRSTSIRFC